MYIYITVSIIFLIDVKEVDDVFLSFCNRDNDCTNIIKIISYQNFRKLGQSINNVVVFFQIVVYTIGIAVLTVYKVEIHSSWNIEIINFSKLINSHVTRRLSTIE